MNNFLLCKEMIPEYFGWVTPSGVPSTLFYSYIPAIILITIITFFIYKNNKTEHNHTVFYLSFLSISAILWMLTTLVQWLAAPVVINIFAWSIIGLLEMFVYIFSLCFFISFVVKKEIGLYYKIILGLILLPILTFGVFNGVINYFNIDECNGYYNLFYTTYIYAFELLSASFVIFWGIWKAKRAKVLDDKKQIIFISIAVFLFQILFTLSSVIGEATLVYGINLFGPIGLVIFVGLLSFLIVRFKAFDIKLLAAQALVWALIIFIGSEFFSVKDLTTQLLVGVTLVISTVLGLILVRSVKKEVALRESLEIANRNQESLIHFVSHQLKGFFTKSKMIFSGLLEGDFGLVPEAVQDVAKVGLTSDNNAVAMIQNILGASNLKTGITDYHLKSVALNDVVKKVCGLFTEEMSKKGLIFETDITEKVLLVSVDETQIIQVFKNLIDNSLNYTPSGKIKVILKTSPDNKKGLFEVSDTGVGLSDEDKSRLFTEGGKGAESIKVNVNSTGYGLYIVKKIVESHKGRVWAESAGRGHGSQFYVELNLVE
jgi:signal transduction histidine kinase